MVLQQQELYNVVKILHDLHNFFQKSRKWRDLPVKLTRLPSMAALFKKDSNTVDLFFSEILIEPGYGFYAFAEVKQWIVLVW